MATHSVKSARNMPRLTWGGIGSDRFMRMKRVQLDRIIRIANATYAMW